MELPQWFPTYEVALILIGVLILAWLRLGWEIGWELVRWWESRARKN